MYSDTVTENPRVKFVDPKYQDADHAMANSHNFTKEQYLNLEI